MAKKQTTPEGMVTIDASVEDWREYEYDDGYVLHIDYPITVYHKAKCQVGGSHRVVDTNGIAHYVLPGWRTIRWAGPVVA